uniref:PUA_2 domain-containing protein n=1 Tax=Macrostomum lignano TaxID=282301 RepID=A0A1I8F6E9_9PLAT
MASNVFQAGALCQPDRRAKVTVRRGFSAAAPSADGVLPGAGKDPPSRSGLEEYLVSAGVPATRSNGDNIRTGLNKKSRADPRERTFDEICEVAKLFADAASSASRRSSAPSGRTASKARRLHEEGAGLKILRVFVKIFCRPRAGGVARARDVKGPLRARPAKASSRALTGIRQRLMSPPMRPDSPSRRQLRSPSESVLAVVDLLDREGLLGRAGRLRDFRGLKLDEIDLQWAQVGLLCSPKAGSHPLTAASDDRAGSTCSACTSARCNSPAGSHGLAQCRAGANRLGYQRRPEREACVGQSSARFASIRLADGKRRTVIGLLHSPSRLFAHDQKRERCARTFRTVSSGHPSVARILASGDWLIGGELTTSGATLSGTTAWITTRLTPRQLRRRFAMNADGVFAFQLRNPGAQRARPADGRYQAGACWRSGAYRQPGAAAASAGRLDKTGRCAAACPAARSMRPVLKAGVLDAPASTATARCFRHRLLYAGPQRYRHGNWGSGRLAQQLRIWKAGPATEDLGAGPQNQFATGESQSPPNRQVQWHAKARMTRRQFLHCRRRPRPAYPTADSPEKSTCTTRPQQRALVLGMTLVLTNSKSCHSEWRLQPLRSPMHFRGRQDATKFEFISGQKMRALARDAETASGRVYGAGRL